MTLDRRRPDTRRRATIARLVRTAQFRELQASRNPDGTDWLWQFLPVTPPKPWQVLQRGGDGYVCRNRETGLLLIASGAMENDGHRWLHVSVSYPDHMPSYLDLAEAKDAFIGPDRYAYQVFPPAVLHVNAHAYALHLFARASRDDGRVLPDFTAGTGSL